MHFNVCCIYLPGCPSQFKQIVASEQNFRVECDHSKTLFGSGLDECKVAACNYSAVVFHYRDDVCEVLLCGASRREDLKLSPVTTGWNIYFKNEELLTTTILSKSDEDLMSTHLTLTPTEVVDRNLSNSTTNDLAPLLQVWAMAVIVIALISSV